MSKHNYKDFVKEKAVETKVEPVEAKVEETTEEVKTEEAANEVVEEKPSFTDPIEEPETTEGIVDGVNTALNIRKEPEIKANNQIAIAGKGAKVIVVDPKNTVKNNGEEWYKVLFNKEPGYAMKKYITIK